MTFKDHFSRQAQAYSRFRPGYPRALFQYLAKISPARQRAWDCATGSGQAAVALAEFFDEVLATDASRTQIAEARPHPRVRYLVCQAEAVPLANQSVDLVTVAQALHWFDRPRFYAEVRRVGRPGSILAVWSYAVAQITPEIDAVVWRIYRDILGPYWPAERKLTEEGYARIDFPFHDLAVPPFAMTAGWNFHEFIGYVETWSSAERFRQQHGTDPLATARDDLAKAWGNLSRVRQVAWPLNVRVGRISG